MLPKKRLLLLPLTISALSLLGSCSEAITRLADSAPVADAGIDQIVDLGSAVIMDAGASFDPDGDQLSYSWQQTGGTAVILVSKTDALISFTAPSEESDLTFSVSVTDSSGQTDSDSTRVYVSNMPEVEIVLEDDQVSEANASLQLRLLLDRVSSKSSTLNLNLAGSATWGIDYELEKSVTIPAGVTYYDSNIISKDNSEADGNKTIAVSIDGGALLTYDSSLTYTITIIDDDTSPVITSASSHTSDDKISDTEYTLSATDDDGDTLIYSITGGDDAGKFLLDASSGALSFASSYFLDFYGDSEVPLVEEPADANADNIYELRLRASDGLNYADTDLSITLVANDNFFAPAISSSSAVNVAELSSSSFYSAGANDDDGSDLTWSISGKDSDHLQISDDDGDDIGELKFSPAADYENPLDTDPRDNIYEINLSVTDGRFTDIQQVNITVTDEPEAAPTLSSGNVYDNNISLEWTTLDGAISYRIYQADSESCLTDANIYTCPQVVRSLSSSFNTYVATDLEPYTDYYFAMLAETAEAYGDFSDILTVTTLLETPAAVQLQALSNAAIHVSWEANADADYYNLFRYSNADCDVLGNYQSCTDVIYQTNIEDALEFNDTGLERAKIYYYQLEAVNAFSQSQPSEQAGLSTAIYHFYNDTGIDYIGEALSGSATDCAAITDASAIAGEQDCHHGRDSSDSITKTGAGVAAFDFTKIGSDGSVLANQTMPWAADGDESLGTIWSCVLDNTTGLLWQVGEPSPTPHQWDEADDEAGSANFADLCGKDDWRLPTIAELHDISYMNESASVFIDTDYFANTLADYSYWSAQAYGDQALAIEQSSATAVVKDSSEELNVRLVSGDIRGEHWSDSRYQDNADGTVIDLVTNLMWLKCVSPMNYDAGVNLCQGSNVAVVWQNALEYAHTFTINDYADWRLPNAKELQSLGVLDADGTGGVNAVFNLDDAEYLHSESPDPASSTNSMQLDIASGLVISRGRTEYADLLLVRDNQ